MQHGYVETSVYGYVASVLMQHGYIETSVWLCCIVVDASLTNLSGSGHEGDIDVTLSYDIASGSEITPCNKICKPLVVY